MDFDKTYKKMQQLAKQMKEIAEAVKPQFEGPYTSNPFESVCYRMKTELAELRKSLIEHTVTKLRVQYMPNTKLDVNFTELMNNKAGETGFKESVIMREFTRIASDQETLTERSLKTIIDQASRLLPYGYRKVGGREVSGKPTSVTEIVKGRFLRLKTHTWVSTRFSHYISIHSHEQLEALEKLIAIKTMRKNPIQVKGNSVGLTNFIHSERKPENFYKKQTVRHHVVESFRFFKNGTLQIDFKKQKDARKVAKALLA